MLNFDPINLTKQVEILQKEIKNLHLQSIGNQSDITDLENKAKKLISRSLFENLFYFFFN